VEWSINKTKTQHYPVVTGYEVIITNTKANAAYTETYSGWKRGKATVNGLLPFTEYTIAVRALMGEHRGPLSETKTVKTGPEELVLGLASSTGVFGVLLLIRIIAPASAACIISIIFYYCKRRKQLLENRNNCGVQAEEEVHEDDDDEYHDARQDPSQSLVGNSGRVGNYGSNNR
jgi:hypothetical protein